MRTETGQSLTAYWQERCGSRQVPDRSDIDPVDIPRLLSEIMMVEVQDQDLLIRLAGTALVQQLGYDPTGKTLSQLAERPGAAGLSLLCQTSVTMQAPQSARVANFGNRDTYDSIDVLALPLTRGGDEIAVLMLTMGFNVTARDCFARKPVHKRPVSANPDPTAGQAKARNPVATSKP